ncbi:hypothetical protein [Nostoc sp. LPT]|nr:hypothetical protein [Nostoc sp. LPT]MBN4002343.1 hypothetical protein [Nostoc sp. LPT]
MTLVFGYRILISDKKFKESKLHQSSDRLELAVHCDYAKPSKVGRRSPP